MTDVLLPEIGIFLAIGLAAGLVGGLLGLGGGIVVVPTLVLVLPRMGVAADSVMTFAIGTSLATIVVTGLASARAHWARGGVDLSAVARLTPGFMLGGLAGGVAAIFLAGALLKGLFGGFLLFVAARTAFHRPPAAVADPPGRWHSLAAGTGIGGMSTLVGVGGGILAVPWLVSRGLGIRRAVGTSAACTPIVALAGTVAHGLLGEGGVSTATGSILWAAALPIALGSILAARAGAALAHRLPRAGLRAGFAVLVGGVGAWFVWQALTALFPMA